MVSGLTIVLDTNILHGDVYARRPWLRALLDGASKGDFEVVVPEAVVMELVRQYPDRLSKAIEETKISLGRLARDYRALNIPPPAVLDLDDAKLVADYEKAIRATLSQAGCRIASHPLDAELAIAWAIQRRRPFKESGQGLPDAIVWLTVLDAAAKADSVLFVTANTSDFCTDSTGAELARELAEDLRARGIPRDRVRVVTDLKQLVDETVTPLADTMARVRRLHEPETWARLAEAVAGALVYLPFPEDGLELDVPLDDDPQATALDVETLIFRSARQLRGGRLLLELEALASMTLGLRISREDAYLVTDTSEIRIIDPEWNDRYAEAEVDLVATFSLQVTTDAAVQSVEVEVLDVERTPIDEVVDRRLEAGRLELFRRLQKELAAEAEVSHYLPPLGSESDIQEARLVSFRPESIVSSESEAMFGFEVECTLEFHGAGDVRWLISVPAPFDLDRYETSVEDDAGEGGWLSDTATSEPLVVLVRALLQPHGMTDDFDIAEISLESEEITRREGLAELPRAIESLLDEERTESSR